MNSGWTLVFAAIYCLGLSTVARPANHTITSPDGSQVISFKLARGVPTYSVSYKDDTILADSRLSLTLDGIQLDSAFRIIGTRKVSKNGEWTPVVGSRSSYPDAYNERVIQLSSGPKEGRRIDLVFRVQKA